MSGIDWNDVSGVMIDMDGTVYKGGNVIPGAPEFIERLKEKGIPFVFLTNNSSSNRANYLIKLLGMGFKVSIDNILTSTTATIEYLLKYQNGKTVYLLGTPRFVSEIEEAGIIVADDADVVLLAFDTTITYERINTAYQLIKRGASLVATHPDDLCPTENGYDVDIGPFIRLFESMTSVKAEVIGKPNPMMAMMAAERMNVPHEGMVMIGDRIYTDMKMATDAGIRSVMVLSGEAKREDVERSGITPTMIVDSVDDLMRQ
ncbi:MAG: HAD-IIA family hydrolase [Methanomassiliicoccaceae archaeon]|nr:HAD-IIA family hydrolase [Methanomassiliicoccaceae archaeon]